MIKRFSKKGNDQPGLDELSVRLSIAALAGCIVGEDFRIVEVVSFGEGFSL